MNAEFDTKNRQEFVFRSREAPKLATAIEFYIEKFMSIMHLWQEGAEGAVDTTASTSNSASQQQTTGASASSPSSTSTRNGASSEPAMAMDQSQVEFQDVVTDLLGGYDSDDGAAINVTASTVTPTKDLSSTLASLSVASPPTPGMPATPTAMLEPYAMVDTSPSPVPVSQQQQQAQDANLFDLLGAEMGSPTTGAGSSVPAPQPPQTPDAPLATTALPAPTAATPSMDDFFGFSDPTPPAPQEGPSLVELAPADAQQMRANMESLLKRGNSFQGVLTENNTVQLMVKCEFRGSQARITFLVINKTPDVLTGLSMDFDVTAVGASALRHQVWPVGLALGSTRRQGACGAKSGELSCVFVFVCVCVCVVVPSAGSSPSYVRGCERQGAVDGYG